MLKGDFLEAEGDWKFSRKMEVGIGWTGDTSLDWHFFLDGYAFDRWQERASIVPACMVVQCLAFSC